MESVPVKEVEQPVAQQVPVEEAQEIEEPKEDSEEPQSEKTPEDNSDVPLEEPEKTSEMTIEEVLRNHEERHLSSEERLRRIEHLLRLDF